MLKYRKRVFASFRLFFFDCDIKERDKNAYGAMLRPRETNNNKEGGYKIKAENDFYRALLPYPVSFYRNLEKNTPHLFT